jgi:NAD(P)-dependent dehydrogenase (short-subunit alcohol dehydrogenase family)
MRFKDKVVFVTGASGGIGRALAIEFSNEGAAVALVARSAEVLHELEAELCAQGKQALALPGDVTDRAVLEQAIHKTVDCFGRLDILVNNAGIGLYAPLATVPTGDFERMMKLNFWSVLWAIQAALPHLEKNGEGRIINISSILGKLDFPWMGAYCASKHAINSLSNALRMELSDRHVEVLTVCPGRVRTQFQPNAIKYKPIENPPGSGMALSPEEVACAVVRAAWKHKREIVLPRKGRLLVALQQFWPRMGDRLAMTFASR